MIKMLKKFIIFLLLHISAFNLFALQELPLKKLTFSGINSKPSWSPDSKKIAYSSYQNNMDNIWIISVENRQLEQITNDRRFNYFPSWSLKADKIAFEATIDNITNVWLYDLESDKSRQLTFDGASWPVYSPDGKSILIKKTILSRDRLYSINLTDNSQIEIYSNFYEEKLSRPIWMPDGKELILVVRPNWLVKEPEGKEPVMRNWSSIWLFSIRGKEKRQLVAGVSGADRSHITVSPNGKYAAYIENDDMCIIPIKSRPVEKPLYRIKINGYGVAWSPDGKTIAFVRVPEYQIYLMSVPEVFR